MNVVQRLNKKRTNILSNYNSKKNKCPISWIKLIKYAPPPQGETVRYIERIGFAIYVLDIHTSKDIVYYFVDGILITHGMIQPTSNIEYRIVEVYKVTDKTTGDWYWEEVRTKEESRKNYIQSAGLSVTEWLIDESWSRNDITFEQIRPLQEPDEDQEEYRPELIDLVRNAARSNRLNHNAEPYTARQPRVQRNIYSNMRGRR